MRWYYLGRALRDAGCQVTLVGASWFHKYHASPDLAEGRHREIDGVNYLWIRTRPYSSRGVGQVVNQLDYVRGAIGCDERDFSHPVDAVVASSPHPLVIFPAARCARRLGVPLVYEVRDLWPRAIMELGSFGAWHPYIQLLAYAERYAVQNAQLITSVKPGDYTHFEQKYGLKKERFAYIPNGFYARSASGREVDLVERVTGAPEQVVVGYVGALSSYYELDILLDAAARMVGNVRYRFVIVGGGEDEARLRARAQVEGLKNVEFVGMQPKSSIPGWLASFDICYLGLKDVSVNRYGISCNKLFEYMAAAKPVVACYRTEHDPVMMANCGLTVAPGDIEALVFSLSWFAENPAEVARMGRSGRDYFSRNHEFGEVANRFLDALRALSIREGV